MKEEKIVAKYQSNLLDIQTVERQIAEATMELQTKLEKLKNKDKEFREALLEAMAQNEVKSYENEFLKITYIAPTTRTTIDVKRFQEEMPKTAKKFEQVSEVKPSVRITLKKMVS